MQRVRTSTKSFGRRMVTSSTILGLNERLLRCGRIQWEDCYHEYTDSPDSDWVIGEFPGLFLATSGSGHAFKKPTQVLQFLPHVGLVVSDILQGKADAAVVAKFSIDRDVIHAANAERVQHVAQGLDLEDLWSRWFAA
ncbi:hypothetical protein SCLCIDRAFT_675338 [Scleroderma citrinum Foug A]|uniref:FAD dependent oxidoreductase domain-containing protein n=1 Tax=Scleroderma citrinum Foug A TaxID=1036808 RepID=A0A0C3DTK4_9AGAM|nr:hypothetical protein SCLCIDRAFT_675338 [Scleroderma citrinum Foug A]